VTNSIQDNETVIASGQVKTRQLQCSKQVAHSKTKREKQIIHSMQDNQSLLLWSFLNKTMKQVTNSKQANIDSKRNNISQRKQ